ncbi:MAG: hypothetical protein Q7S32_04120 [bacterium]|nr:hypothetical protein [bacterium]
MKKHEKEEKYYMNKVEIPEDVVGKHTVNSCSYYPIGVDAGGSVMGVECGQIEVSSDGRVKLGGFVLPQEPRTSHAPFFVELGLAQCRGAINSSWGGDWRIESVHPGWPDTRSIYLTRGSEEISLHGLKTISTD